MSPKCETMSCLCTGIDSTCRVAHIEHFIQETDPFMYRYFSQKAAGERKQKKEEEREKERDSTANVDELEPSERDFAEMNFARLVSSAIIYQFMVTLGTIAYLFSDLEFSQLERQVKARNRKRKHESDSSESEKELESDEGTYSTHGDIETCYYSLDFCTTSNKSWANGLETRLTTSSVVN